MTQVYRVVIIEQNSQLREKLVEACNAHMKLEVVKSIDSVSNMIDYLRNEELDILLISGRNDSAIKIIEEAIAVKPMPILFVTTITEKLEFPSIFNLGFIDAVEIKVDSHIPDYSNVKIPNLVAIKCVILAKLNMKRFMYQVDLYLDGKIDTHLINRANNRNAKHLEAKMSKKIKRRIVSKTGKVSSKDIIVVGASTGGPKILMYLISQFPRHFPPVLLVQHMPVGFIDSFASRMNDKSQMTVQMGRTGDKIKRGHVYIAPGGMHLEVKLNKNDEPVIDITDGPTVNFVKPSVDVTLFSAVRIWGGGVISLILTGMGNDGREGTRVVKKHGGRSIALNEEDSVIYGMNKSIVNAGLADHVLPLDEITVKLGEILGFKVASVDD